MLIVERSPTEWEWRVCDRYGTTIMDGFECTREAAKYRGNCALFLLLLHHVFQTQDSVLLDDVSEQTPYSGDEYFRGNQSQSILCLPLTRLGNLVGILCLENNLTRNVFTPARIAVLNLLASQAAIALQNAQRRHRETESYRPYRSRGPRSAGRRRGHDRDASDPERRLEERLDRRRAFAT